MSIYWSPTQNTLGNSAALLKQPEHSPVKPSLTFRGENDTDQFTPKKAGSSADPYVLETFLAPLSDVPREIYRDYLKQEVEAIAERRQLPPDDPQVVDALEARILAISNGFRPLNEYFFRYILNVRESKQGASHPATVQTILNLARVLDDSLQLAENTPGRTPDPVLQAEVGKLFLKALPHVAPDGEDAMNIWLRLASTAYAGNVPKQVEALEKGIELFIQRHGYQARYESVSKTEFGDGSTLESNISGPSQLHVALTQLIEILEAKPDMFAGKLEKATNLKEYIWALENKKRTEGLMEREQNNIRYYEENQDELTRFQGSQDHYDQSKANLEKLQGWLERVTRKIAKLENALGIDPDSSPPPG